MADWFTSLASSALKFADDLTDSLVSQANEAQASMQDEQRKLKQEEELKRQIKSTHLLLPWETMVEARQILSKALMENILALSGNDKNFLLPAANEREVAFSIADFAPTAMKMMELDSNLSRMHAKLSPKMNEEDFWFHYYCRIIYLRGVSGIEGIEAQKAAERWPREEIIMPSHLPEPVAAAPKVVPVAVTPTRSPAKGPDTLSNTSSKSAIAPVVTDLDLDGLDLDDLGDLKDLDLLDDDLGDDFENIGSSECDNDELEAQIARELEELK